MLCSINPCCSLHWISWDDEYVVFDEASGQTHQMDAVRALILNTLITGAHNIAELLRELTDFAVLKQSPELSKLLITILDEFRTNGLVEVVSQ